MGASSSSLDLESFLFPLPPSNKKFTETPETLKSCVLKESPKKTSPKADVGLEPIQKALARSPVQLQQTPSTAPLNTRHLSPALNNLADGAASIVSGRPLSAVDSALVEVISRSIAEQLRMLSISTESETRSTNTPDSIRGSKASNVSRSRTSSQKEALKRFAKELHKYAEQTNAKGQVPNLTPSSRSPATLHTISALLPYRREFKAAGLAVTSKDQARKTPVKKRLASLPNKRRNVVGSDGKPVRVSQMDGKEELTGQKQSSSEVSFANPDNIDEWRYALIDEVPSLDRHGKDMTLTKAKRICLPCFPTHIDGRESVQENVKRSLASAPIVVGSAPSHSRSLGRAQAPSHIPMPSAAMDPAEPSPRHLCDGVESMQPLNMHLKATGYRRPSMTVSQSNGHLESCRGGHSYTHPDAEIHKHNPRPTNTQYLHPEAAIRPRNGIRQNRPVAPEHLGQKPSTSGHWLTTGISLPNFAISKLEKATVPPRLRHTVGHLPARPQGEKRTLVVRNPTEPIIKPVLEAGTEKLFPFKAAKKRTSVSTKRRSKLMGPRRIRPAIPMRASSILQSIRSTDLDHDRRVSDRQVLRGLHVATSAACDEEVDAYVGDKSGVRIRQFLADLVALETYWNDTHSLDDKEQRARRRRAQMRKLKQHMRRSRDVRHISGQSN